MAGRVEERYSMRAPLTPKFEGGSEASSKSYRERCFRPGECALTDLGASESTRA